MPQGKEEFEKSAFSENLRGLSLGLTCTRDRANGSRYREMDLPSYKEVLRNVCSKLERVSEDEQKSQVDEQQSWDFQEILLIAMQTLLPPMRGRPFWDLDLVEKGKNSMIFLFNAFFMHTFVSDFVKILPQSVYLVIRRQKTSRCTGTVTIPLPARLGDYMRIWLQKYRPYIEEEFRPQTTAVFLNPKCMRPFTSKTFSRFCSAAFVRCTGMHINLQMMRHIFASGL